MAPHTGADVVHLVVKLFTVSGTAEAPVTNADQKLSQDVTKVLFGTPIRFKKLQQTTKYRVRGYAYDSPGTLDYTKISVDADSLLDVDVTDDDRPTEATLSIQLKTKTFSAQVSNSLNVKPGAVNDKGGESVTTGRQS